MYSRHCQGKGQNQSIQCALPTGLKLHIDLVEQSPNRWIGCVLTSLMLHLVLWSWWNIGRISQGVWVEVTKPELFISLPLRAIPLPRKNFFFFKFFYFISAVQTARPCIGVNASQMAAAVGGFGAACQTRRGSGGRACLPDAGKVVSICNSRLSAGAVSSLCTKKPVQRSAVCFSVGLSRVCI